MKFQHPALKYHAFPVSGKWSMYSSKPMNTWEDLELAYTPGVALACTTIAEHPETAYDLTNKSHLVAVISNGTAVLGLGNIGPLAAKPVMEGKCALIRQFAGLNSIDLELDESDPYKLIEHIAALAPSFGAINLEDIKSPDCFIVEQALIERLNIPVFHDDQHGTAIVVCASILNGLYIKGIAPDRAIVAVNGAGAGALACVNLLCQFGVNPLNVRLCDSKGVVHSQRQDLNHYKKPYAYDTERRTLKDALQGADVFLGLSTGGVVNREMIRGMNPDPLVFALANPVPEILPEDIYAEHPGALVSTGRSDYPNQINNLLCFPYIFRGALEVRATRITDAMKHACVHALMDIAREGEWGARGAYQGHKHNFGSQYFIPKAFDPRLRERLPLAVAKAAITDNVSSCGASILEALGKKLTDEAHELVPLFQALYVYRKYPTASLPKITLVLSYDVEAQEAFPVWREALLALQSYGMCTVKVCHPEGSVYAQDHSIPPFEHGVAGLEPGCHTVYVHGASQAQEAALVPLMTRYCQPYQEIHIEDGRNVLSRQYIHKMMHHWSTILPSVCGLSPWECLDEDAIVWRCPLHFRLPCHTLIQLGEEKLYFSTHASVAEVIEGCTLAMGLWYVNEV